MTDNEIIKALECCNGDLNCCKECPAKEYNVECGDILKFNALKLINRQKAEIERLAEYNENLRCENYNLEDDLLFGIKKARSEAIREFAKELMFNLDEDIGAYANAGHGLNVYEWLYSYLRSKRAIKEEGENG